MSMAAARDPAQAILDVAEQIRSGTSIRDRTARRPVRR
jgi:hypothetical protein